ncbi:MAG: hypothetical protein MN733_05645, partial [Nitrososphaera sp.]|nr:hypothetical protein [Nitrososphaera sp.]
MVAFARAVYTRSLKRHRVKRGEINLKSNAAKRAKVIKDMGQWYQVHGADEREILVLIRRHGVRIPKEASRDILTFSGIRIRARTDREAIGNIKRLKSDAIPRDSDIYHTTS